MLNKNPKLTSCHSALKFFLLISSYDNVFNSLPVSRSASLCTFPNNAVNAEAVENINVKVVHPFLKHIKILHIPCLTVF